MSLSHGFGWPSGNTRDDEEGLLLLKPDDDRDADVSSRPNNTTTYRFLAFFTFLSAFANFGLGSEMN